MRHVKYAIADVTALITEERLVVIAVKANIMTKKVNFRAKIVKLVNLMVKSIKQQLHAKSVLEILMLNGNLLANVLNAIMTNHLQPSLGLHQKNFAQHALCAIKAMDNHTRGSQYFPHGRLMVVNE